MMLARLRVEFFCMVIIMPLLLACVSTKLHVDKQSDSRVELDVSALQPGLQGSLKLQQDSVDQMEWARLVGSHGKNLPSELSALGVSRIERVDVGFIGKMGPSVVFAAEKRLVSSYNRLYWVMIRVLSEKYGCFARRKIDRGELVAFKCRDQRIVTFRRRMTDRFAVFKARQYGFDGREIVVVRKRPVLASRSKVVAR